MDPLPLLREHFQLGYVVRSAEKAAAAAADRFGVRNWQLLPVEDGPSRTVGLAFVGQRMLELVEPHPDRDSIYRDWLPETDSELRLHHLGYMVHREDDWDRIAAHCEAAGFARVLEGGVPNWLDFRYFDTRGALGHYCEFILPRPLDRDVWARVPRN